DAGLDAELGQRVAHLDCGTARTKRIVLTHLRYPEDRHHRVADELLHRAAVRLDDALHPLEVPGEARARRATSPCSRSTTRARSARSASVWVDSRRAVEPVTSQKRTVTVLRCCRD